MINEPYYDEDLVNKAYLDKVLGNTTEIIENDINMVKNYGTQPQPPYHKGDTYTDDNKLYVCIQSREVGIYESTDWNTESGAITLAQSALDVAIVKTRTYLVKPTSYNSCDMWILENDTVHVPDKTGTILISLANSNIYVADHWVKRDKYTDDTTANTAIVNASAAQIAADNAQSTATTVAGNLTTVENNINTINQNLDGMTFTVGQQQIAIDTNTNEILNINNDVSQVQLAINEIDLEVSNKVNSSEIISKINLTTEQIKILASKLKLEGYTTINGTFTVDLEGNVSIANNTIILNNTGITLTNGARLIGGNGVLSCFEFDTGNWDWLGCIDSGGNGFLKHGLLISAYVPANFVVISAKIVLRHAPFYWMADWQLATSFWGGAISTKLYKETSINNYYAYGNTASTPNENVNAAITEITGAFGTNGYTAVLPSVTPGNNPTNTVQEITSTDISSQITAGSYNYFRIQTSVPDNTIIQYDRTQASHETGLGIATLVVIGYMKQ